MKLLNKNIIGLVSIFILLSSHPSFAQDATKGDLNVSLNYFINNNKIPYLLAKVKTKVEGKFTPVAGIRLHLFLNNDAIENSIGTVVTNNKGEATAIIPASAKAQWASSIKHTFLASFEGDKRYASTKADLTVGKAKILIDTTSDRKITATVLEMKDTSWVPVKGVELKMGVRRLDADISVNETATFTTDSIGQATAEFKRDSIPGDANGMITLVAKMEDNDQYGNLLIELPVAWGAKFTPVSTFNRRTLFATRDKAPIWLMFIAYSIVFTVWGILVSLVVTVFKIKKIGETA